MGFPVGQGVAEGGQGLSAAGGDFGTDVGNAGNGGLVGRYATQSNSNVLVHPVALPGGKHIAVPVQMAQIGGQIVHDLLLIGFQLHSAASLQLRDVPWDFFECDMPPFQFRLAQGALVGINGIPVRFGFDAPQKIAA